MGISIFDKDNTNEDFQEMQSLYNYEKDIDYDYEIDYEKEFDYENDTFEELFEFLLDTSNDNNVVAVDDGLELSKDNNDEYFLIGARQSLTLDLSYVGIVNNSQISWQETLNNQNIIIETNLSLDGGSTYQGWEIVSNGGNISGLSEGVDVSDGLLDVRQTFETTDSTVTPRLESIEIGINSGEKICDNIFIVIEEDKIINAENDSFDTTSLAIIESEEDKIINVEKISNEVYNILVLEEKKVKNIKGSFDNLNIIFSNLSDTGMQVILGERLYIKKKEVIDSSIKIDLGDFR